MPRSTVRRGRIRPALLGLVITMTAVTACTATSTGVNSAASPGPASSSATPAPSARTTVTTTVTTVTVTPHVSAPPTRRTSAVRTEAPTTITTTVGTGGVVTAGPPPSTPMAATVTQDCPYLSALVVKYIAGERSGNSTVTQYQPYPTCTYYHQDGRWTGSIQVIVAANPASAVAAVNQHVPVATSVPQNVPTGWVGGSELLADRAVYGVSRGNVAIIAQEDENEYSAKARNMAVCAIYGLKLQAGPTPSYCLPGTEG